MKRKTTLWKGSQKALAALSVIEPGAIIATDSWSGYNIIDKEQFGHEKTNQYKKGTYENLYGVHLVTTLIKRLIRGTFHGIWTPYPSTL
ncbi:MAG: transposase [Desulfobulbaceae bacterium]|nr:transposase [Desulfobulbaceae bacterium]